MSCIDWHVRCRDCGDAAIWLTRAEANLWADTHHCPPPTQPNTRGASA